MLTLLSDAVAIPARRFMGTFPIVDLFAPHVRYIVELLHKGVDGISVAHLSVQLPIKLRIIPLLIGTQDQVEAIALRKKLQDECNQDALRMLIDRAW